MSTTYRSSPGALPVRDLASGDLFGVAAALAASLVDDPPMVWLFGGDVDRRRRHLLQYMRAEAQRAVRKGGRVLTIDGHHGASVWAAPGEWRHSW